MIQLFRLFLAIHEIICFVSHKPCKDGQLESESELSGDTIIPSGPSWVSPTHEERKRWNGQKHKAIEQSFHEAMGMMGIDDDSKPTKIMENTVKIPYLKPPASWEPFVDELLMMAPPTIGPQVT